MLRLIAILARLGARRPGRSLLWGVLVCGALPAAAADAPPEIGRTVYNARCYVCHGYSGDARTLAARFLQPPPRDFTRPSPRPRSRAELIEAVTRGRPGTAMKPFAGLLTPAEIAAVVDFVRHEFMEAVRPNTRYHTAANGWPDFERDALAAPFATGELALDTPWERMDARQRAGWKRFLASCISCHDRGRVTEDRVVWERQALSYPRFEPEAYGAGHAPDGDDDDVYDRHQTPPRVAGLSAREREGEALFLANCAYCHAADGTGRNWIGRFLQPHPPDFTDRNAMVGRSREALRRSIRDGLPGTAMPAWGRVLSAAQVDALIAYLSRAFHGLPSQAGASRPPPRSERAQP